MSKTVLLVLISVLCASAHLVGCRSGPPPETQPVRNVIVVSLDTLRRDGLGCYGHQGATSPTIDRLAAEGTVFRNASTTAPWTLPSHVSMLTGLYPYRHGVREVRDRRGTEHPTLPSLLRDSAMHTAAFVNSEFLQKQAAFGGVFDEFRYISEWGSKEDGFRFVRDSGAQVTDAALAWMQDNSGEPFFTFLHYYDVHADYDAKSEHRSRSTRDYQGGMLGTNQQLAFMRMGKFQPPDADINHLMALYDAGIRQVDVEIARLVGFLKDQGLLDATLMVITADHGEEFYEHGSVLHGRTFYEEVIGIPLIMRGPGVPRGRAFAEPVSLVDIVPTILSLLNLPVPAATQGMNLAALWQKGQTAVRHHPIVAEADWKNEFPNSFRMTRDDRYKLIYATRTQTAELYDLMQDPAETVDIADQHPQIVSAMIAQLDAMKAGENVAAPAPPVSAEGLERLRALGYVD